MGLTRIAEEIVIDAPRREAWAAIADYGNVHTHVQGIAASRLTSDVAQGIGATRHCDLPGPPGRNYIVEEIVDWREGDSFTYVVLATNAPVTDARVHRPKLGPLGSVLNALVIRRTFRKQFREGLADFKREVEGAGTPPAAAVSAGRERP